MKSLYALRFFRIRKGTWDSQGDLAQLKMAASMEKGLLVLYFTLGRDEIIFVFAEHRTLSISSREFGHTHILLIFVAIDLL